MRFTPAVIAILILTLPQVASPVDAAWRVQGSVEPDTPEDRTGLHMTLEPPGSWRSVVYFNALSRSNTIGLSPNSALLGSRLDTGISQSWFAYLGLWRDCNQDGYIGLGETGRLDYDPLLGSGAICPAGSAHNDGTWIHEFLWIGPADTVGDLNLDGRIDDDIAAHAQTTRHDPDALVWGDRGRPGASDTLCPIQPPQGTTASTGGIIGFTDCHLNHRGAYYIGYAEEETIGDWGLTFEDREHPERSPSVLNQHTPATLWGDPHAEGGPTPGVLEDGGRSENEPRPAFHAFDCSDPNAFSIRDPQNGGTIYHTGRITLDTQELTSYLQRPTSYSFYDTLNHTADAAVDGCDTNHGEALAPLTVEAGAFQGTSRATSDITFRFQTNTAPAIPGQIPAPVPSLGGLTKERSTLHSPGWVGTMNGAERPNLVRSDGRPGGAQYFTFYAHLGVMSTSMGWTLPPTTGLYGASACNGMTYGEHNGFQCDPTSWWRDEEGASVMPTQRFGPQRSADPDSPWGPARAVGVRVWERYHLRDVDCLDGTVVDGRPAYLSLQYFTDEESCAASGAGALAPTWKHVPELDEDFNGIGDSFQSKYKLSRQAIEDALRDATDWDLDQAGLIEEFRWDTIPLAIPPDIPLERSRDWDDDKWLDGDEIRYWNANPDPIAPFRATGGLAYRDDDSYEDTDKDGLVNQHDPDSDDDGVPDGIEVHQHGTYPEAADSDCADLGTCPAPTQTRFGDPMRSASPGDLFADKAEHAYWTAHPTGGGPHGDCDRDGTPNIRDRDSDNDDMIDGIEVQDGSDPCDADSDDDGLPDGTERTLGTNSTRADTDGDGMPDRWEHEHRPATDPRLANDATLDPDSDGLSNQREWQHQTDPLSRDTDKDTLDDGHEIARGTDPHEWDTDHDGMPDGWEVEHGLLPTTPDGHLDLDGDVGVREDAQPYIHTNFFEYATGRPATWNEDDQGPWLRGTLPETKDTDGDGKTDGDEVARGDDPTSPLPRFDQDADDDGLLIEDELDRHTSPVVADSDQDGLCDGGRNTMCVDALGLGTRNAPGEVNDFGSNPMLLDSDGDGLTDGEEVLIFSNGAGTTHDLDGDGTPSILDQDSDGDGLGDHEEARSLPTDPARADSDGDGLDDHAEIVLSVLRGHPTNATDHDTDDDGLLDGEEVDIHFTFPDLADTDADGLDDANEIRRYGTSPFLPDSDGDRMPDKWEIDHGLDPLRNDASEDPDRDGIVLGLSNYEEYVRGTDPQNPDTDGDLINDQWEVFVGLSPTSSNLLTDSDNDGLLDLGEFLLRADPLHNDTDRDGLSDWEEAGSNDIAFLAARLTPSDPTLIDTDDDGLEDAREKELWIALGGEAAWRTDHDGDAPATASGASSGLRDADSDGDGLDDGQEFLVFSTRPDLADTDGDGDPDGAEILVFFTDPHDRARNRNQRAAELAQDTDGDGLSDAEEAMLRTDPNDRDTDRDGMPDGSERAAWGPRFAVDLDEDGFLNNLLDPDSDNDGTLDGIEFIASGLSRRLFFILDPGSADTDSDGLLDGDEATNGLFLIENDTPSEDSIRGAFGLFLRPQASTNGGSTAPGRAGSARSSPDQSDTDSDCLRDGMERDLGSDPHRTDSDGDGIPDCQERSARAARNGLPVVSGLCNSPYDADRDCLLDISDDDDDDDGLPDGTEDLDGSGTRNPGETSAWDADTDDDGICDGTERTYRTDPTNADTDQDGLSDGLEVRLTTPCQTRARSDWSAGGTLIAAGRPALQPFLGDPNAPEPIDADSFPPALDWDSDDDRTADGLEDWSADGVVDPGEGNPWLADGDGDGIPDSVELQVFGKMSLETFLREAARLTGTSDIAAAKRLATYDPSSKIKTDPTSQDTDRDGILDGSDIDPNGLAAPIFRIRLEKLGMFDWIDCDPFCNFRIDPYFKFEINTTLSTIRPETKNLPELPLARSGELIDISGLMLKLAEKNEDPTKKVSEDTKGFLEVELSDDIATLVRVPDANGNAIWDRIIVRVMLGDWDGEWHEGKTGGRDASDVVDISPHVERSEKGFEMAFRLSEFGTRLREDKRDIPPPQVPDGTADGHGTKTTWNKEDNGILHLRIENHVKADFLMNADTLRNPIGKIAIPSGQEFGA